MSATNLTSLDAVAMGRLLAAGDVSSEELVKAHLDVAQAIQPRTRAFTEILADRALADARRLDEERRQGKVRSALHGVPMTVKESLDVAGAASTLGIPARRDRRSSADAVIVDASRQAGLVVIGRTNVPQLLLSHECDNPIFGRAVNPMSAAHAPGGSSGGEATAIGLGASPLGIGTDIGGSIRVPAHFSGICGLKPSLDRWSNRGSNGAMIGQEIVRSQCGPMARRARDVVAFWDVIDGAAMAQRDPLVSLADAEDDGGALRIGVFTSDGQVPSSASVARAVTEAGAALAGLGHTVLPFSPPGVDEALACYFGALSSDGGATLLAALEGAPLSEALSRLLLMTRLPPFARSALGAALRLRGESHAAKLVSWVGRRDVTAYWALTRRARAYRLRLLDAMADAGVDALICPAHATAALPHGASTDFALAGSTSMLFNLVQFPGGVVPVTRVHRDEVDTRHPESDTERRAARVDAASEGLPIGVQIVAPPRCDARVLRLMVELDELLTSTSDRPPTPARIP